jgi:hypothetical protein
MRRLEGKNNFIYDPLDYDPLDIYTDRHTLKKLKSGILPFSKFRII